MPAEQPAIPRLDRTAACIFGKFREKARTIAVGDER
jgi:hypothetical protein